MATQPDRPTELDLTGCDREPIHLAGSIQPHGLLLIADPQTLVVVGGAGQLEPAFGDDWLGARLSDLLAQDVAALIARTSAGPGGTVIGEPVLIGETVHDVALHRTDGHLLIELEPASGDRASIAASLAWLDAAAANFERAADLERLCDRAAVAFRALTGFDRVMIYRFLDDEAGRVVAEDRDPAMTPFLHHHFPATDIPRQARALYVRNRTRVIPDVGYRPMPIVPADLAQLDLSDVAVRSVSPVHVQYLENMGIGASASISIVKDGVLWGLVACHHRTPRLLTRDVRAAAGALAGGLARQIRAREDADRYRERLRLRAAEDEIHPCLAVKGSLADCVHDTAGALRRMFDGDGFAYVAGSRVSSVGVVPPNTALVAMAQWATRHAEGEPFATHHLAGAYPAAAPHAAVASGLLAVPLVDEGATLLWTRAEQPEEIEWAGNPHKAVDLRPGEHLTPRASFETWIEAVRGRSRRWSLETVDAAQRLRRTLQDARRTRQLADLNAALEAAVASKDVLIAQKDILMREVDHRVQNSLQLVAAFLSLQAREAGPGPAADHLAEARARLSAVALVHRRLYRDDQIETIDLARYIEDLAGDMKASLGAEWQDSISLDLAPVLVPTDRAVNVGLVMTELVINASKYAYGGAAGPLLIRIEQHRDKLRLIVADEGGGKKGAGSGFGSRMMQAVIGRIDGTLDLLDNEPGLRAILTAPIEDRAKH